MGRLLLFILFCSVSFIVSSQNLYEVYITDDGDSIVLSQEKSYIAYNGYIGKISKVKETKSRLILKYQKESEHFQKFTSLNIEPLREKSTNEFIIIQLLTNGMPILSCGIYTYYKKQLSYCGDFDTIATVFMKRDIFSDDSIFYIRFCYGNYYYPYILKVNSWEGDRYKINLGQSDRFYDFSFKKSDIIRCKKKKHGCMSCKFKTYNSYRKNFYPASATTARISLSAGGGNPFAR